MDEVKRFAARESSWVSRDGSMTGSELASFSIGVGEVRKSGRSPAAVYRVAGKPEDFDLIYGLADRLAAWLTEHVADGREDLCSPAELLRATTWARIELTPAGRRAGFRIIPRELQR